jgi:hypothetical protein
MQKRINFLTTKNTNFNPIIIDLKSGLTKILKIIQFNLPCHMGELKWEHGGNPDFLSGWGYI